MVLATVFVFERGLRFRTGDTIHLQFVIGLECFNGSFGFRSVDSVLFPAVIAEIVQACLNSGEFLQGIQATEFQVPLRCWSDVALWPNFQQRLLSIGWNDLFHEPASGGEARVERVANGQLVLHARDRLAFFVFENETQARQRGLQLQRVFRLRRNRELLRRFIRNPQLISRIDQVWIRPRLPEFRVSRVLINGAPVGETVTLRNTGQTFSLPYVVLNAHLEWLLRPSNRIAVWPSDIKLDMKTAERTMQITNAAQARAGGLPRESYNDWAGVLAATILSTAHLRVAIVSAVSGTKPYRTDHDVRNSGVPRRLFFAKKEACDSTVSHQHPLRLSGC